MAGADLHGSAAPARGRQVPHVRRPGPGAYHFYVNYWGNFGNSGYHFDEATRLKPIITVRMTLVTHENTAREKRESFIVPLRNIGDLTAMHSLVWR